MFDSAVLTFGTHVENQLQERDDQGRPKHSLRELLDMPYTPEELRQVNAQSLRHLNALARRVRSGIDVN